MPLTWVPWPPADRVSVSSGPASTTWQADLERVAGDLLVGDDGAGAVGLGEVGVVGVDAGVDDADADAGAVETRAVRAGEGVERLLAAGGRVRGVLRELDRLVALDVGDTGLAADVGDLRLGAAGDHDPDLVEAGGDLHARGGDRVLGGLQGLAVHQHGGRLQQAQVGELLGQVGLQRGGRGGAGRGAGQGEGRAEGGSERQAERGADGSPHGSLLGRRWRGSQDQRPDVAKVTRGERGPGSGTEREGRRLSRDVHLPPARVWCTRCPDTYRRFRRPGPDVGARRGRGPASATGRKWTFARCGPSSDGHLEVWSPFPRLGGNAGPAERLSHRRQDRLDP